MGDEERRFDGPYTQEKAFADELRGFMRAALAARSWGASVEQLTGMAVAFTIECEKRFSEMPGYRLAARIEDEMEAVWSVTARKVA